jgi:hypothetical protein
VILAHYTAKQRAGPHLQRGTGSRRGNVEFGESTAVAATRTFGTGRRGARSARPFVTGPQEEGIQLRDRSHTTSTFARPGNARPKGQPMADFAQMSPFARLAAGRASVGSSRDWPFGHWHAQLLRSLLPRRLLGTTGGIAPRQTQNHGRKPHRSHRPCLRLGPAKGKRRRPARPALPLHSLFGFPAAFSKVRECKAWPLEETGMARKPRFAPLPLLAPIGESAQSLAARRFH